MCRLRNLPARLIRSSDVLHNTVIIFVDFLRHDIITQKLNLVLNSHQEVAFFLRMDTANELVEMVLSR